MDDVPELTLVDPLSIADEVTDAPHITLVDTHAERDRSADLGTTESNRSISSGLTTYDVYTPGTVSTFLPLFERTVKNRRPDIFLTTQHPCNKAPFLDVLYAPMIWPTIQPLPS
jgi:hypothetical protein